MGEKEVPTSQWAVILQREAGSEVGNDQLTDKGRVAEVRQELGGQGWSEYAVRELTGVRDPVTQHRAGRVQNQILQMPEAPSYGWSTGWLRVPPPAHAHGIVLMLDYVPPGNQSMLMDSGCVCEVTTTLLLLCCECFFFYCLLTLAKKHRLVWEQRGALKFNDDNEHAKEVITTRRAWFFPYLQKKGLEQWKEWKRIQVIGKVHMAGREEETSRRAMSEERSGRQGYFVMENLD